MTGQAPVRPGEPNRTSVADRLRPIAVRARRRVVQWSYIDRSTQVETTTVVAGSGRSGTTWVGEVIDRHHDHRVVFEPLHPSVPLAAGFTHGQYLRPGAEDPERNAAMARILGGRFRDPWTDHQTHARLPRRRLVKVIRANCLLGWMAKAFPRAHLVLVMRHPAAVSCSARQLGWNDHLAELVGQAELLSDHLDGLDGFEDLVTLARAPFERFVLQWCIENMIALRTLTPDRVHLAFYEVLAADPVTGFGDLLTAIGQVGDSDLDAVARTPSKLSQGGSGRRGTWLGQLSLSERSWMLEALSVFGLRRIYGDDPEPDEDEGQKLLATRWTPAQTSGASEP